MKSTGKTGREAGGTFREPSFVFIVEAWWTEKVESWARQQLSMIVQMKMGRILITTLTSSTSSTEHLFKTAALFKNLRLSDGNFNDCRSSINSSSLGLWLVGMLATAFLELLDPLELKNTAATRTCIHIYQLKTWVSKETIVYVKTTNTNYIQP